MKEQSIARCFLAYLYHINILITSKNRLRKIDIKTSHTDFCDIININNIDSKNRKVVEKSYRNNFIYYTGFVTPYSVNPLYIIFNEINGCIEEDNRIKYLKQSHVDKNKMYEVIWNEIKNLTES